MRKNIWTLVRVYSDRSGADTYVRRSFEKLDDGATKTIYGCIEEDYEDACWDEGESLDSHFLLSEAEVQALDNGGFTEDFSGEGVPVWELNEGDDSCTTYVLHCSICEYADQPVLTISKEELTDMGFDMTKVTDRDFRAFARSLAKVVTVTAGYMDAVREGARNADFPEDELAKIKEYIRRYGRDGVLEIDEDYRPRWTFWDNGDAEHNDDDGYTDEAEKLRLTEDGDVEVFWRGERSHEGVWEEFDDDPGESGKGVSFTDELLDNLYGCYGIEDGE